ncbi:MAG: class I SAM-dependent methyltransferase [Candidatus Diapherotrites archaeon]
MAKRDLVWLWETSLHFMYNGTYVKSLDALFRGGKIRKILDGSCGVGYPAIELKKLGYDLVCTDGSRQMLAQFRRNCAKEGVKIRALHARWRELPKQFGEEFDAVMCRGNSLPYAVSWGREEVDCSRAKDEIARSIKAFYSVLAPGGLCYVDCSPRESFTPKQTIFNENFGRKKISGEDVELKWKITHDLVRHVRTWEPEAIVRAECNGGTEQTERVKLLCRAYHMRHSELLEFMKEAGFKDIETYVDIAGEKNYDVFLARK